MALPTLLEIGTFVWQLIAILGSAYLAYKILPAVGELVEVAKDWAGFKRGKIRLKADVAGFDLDDLRVKHEAGQTELEEILALKAQLKEKKKDEKKKPKE